MELDDNHCDPSIFLAPFFAPFFAVLGQIWFFSRGCLNNRTKGIYAATVSFILGEIFKMEVLVGHHLTCYLVWESK